MSKVSDIDRENEREMNRKRMRTKMERLKELIRLKQK